MSTLGLVTDNEERLLPCKRREIKRLWARRFDRELLSFEDDETWIAGRVLPRHRPMKTHVQASRHCSNGSTSGSDGVR
jgi:hypothetical protein